MKRLFTFGCSMTNYHYPTWADILGTTYDYYENWGKPTSGNHFIFHSVLECDKKNNFTSDDTIIIMWSSFTRLDYYAYNEWKSCNHLLAKNENDKLIPDIRGYELMNCNYIFAINELLNGNNGKNVNISMLQWYVPYFENNDIMALYNNELNNIISVAISNKNHRYKNPEYKDFVANRMYNRLKGKDWPSIHAILDKNFNTTDTEILYFLNELNKYGGSKIKWINDKHPLPSEHLEIVLKHFPDSTLSNKTIKWIEDINYKLLNGIMYDHHPKNVQRF